VRVHINRPDVGKPAALCGARPQVLTHGGPATADCRRCLVAISKETSDWGNMARRRLIRLATKGA
jgi:hypothetical protein